MRRLLLIGIGVVGLSLQSLYLGAQVQDFFSDLNITVNPEWYGDLEEFKINEAEQLQLSAQVAGESMIYTGFNLAEGEKPQEIWWLIDIRLAFSPSGNNYFRYYLWMNNPDPNSPDFQSYYLHIGETGSLDGVDLYYGNAAGDQRIIDGLPGLSTASDNSHHLLVKWKSSSGWTIQASANQSEWLTEQGSGHQSWSPENGFLGIHCTYTSSNLSRFYIDNVYAGPPLSDQIPPTISDHEIILPSKLLLTFSELLDSLSARNPENYKLSRLSPDPGELAVTIHFQASQARMVELTLDSGWQSDNLYKLEIHGLKDTSQNIMPDTILSILYHQTQRFDVVFTEIMADPTPVIELPDAEFLELFNRTDYLLEMKNWQLLSGSSIKFLPEYQFKPGEYLILTASGRCRDFGPFVNCIEVLGSNQLTNSSGQIVLQDSNARLISFCEYELAWHTSSYHADGGYSLEKQDSENFCEGKENWVTSRSANGGTPGFANHVSSSNPDNSEPRLQRAFWIDTLSYGLVLSESLPDLHQSAEIIFLNDTIPCYCETMDPLYRLFSLWPAYPLDPNQCYTVSSSKFYDCNMNPAISNLLKICQPAAIEPGDIVINEILFNPIADDPDYIELYNRSTKVLDLNKLIIAKRNSFSHVLEEIKSLSSLGYLIFPGDYLVLTANPGKIRERYWTHNAEAFLEPGLSLPGMANESGNLALCDQGMVLIDYLEYTEDQHFSLFNTFEGVSLEKINPHILEYSPNNWHSAAETIGWGSPGIQNSQFNVEPVSASHFSLGLNYFTPNQDGDKDLLAINYHLNSAGYLLSLKIVNHQGYLIKTLEDYVLTGAIGTFFWNGLDENERLSATGVYFVFIDYYHPNGGSGRERLDFVLGGQPP